MKKHIFFINGQGGTGKTSLVEYFLKHPIKNWLFFDYDHGAIKAPKDAQDKEAWKLYKTAQTSWWIEVANAHTLVQDMNLAILGAFQFPWKIEELEAFPLLKDTPIHHAFLYCKDEERKRRLEQRGDGHLWTAHSGSDEELLKKIEQYGSKKFDTSLQTIPEVAEDIRNFLHTLR